MERFENTMPGALAGTVLAVGEILWDLLPTGPRLGGAMANFALGCAQLGLASRLISCVGEDERGDEALASLEATRAGGGVRFFDTALIQRTPSAPTGVVDVVFGADGRPAYDIALPAAWDHLKLTAEALAASAGARAICFGTLAQRSEPSRATLRQLVTATPDSCLRVFDANVRAPFLSEEVLRWSLAHATAAKISDEELDVVSGASGGAGFAPEVGGAAAVPSAEACGRALLAAYPNLQVLAVTMGPHGSLLLTRDQADYHKGFPIAVKDTVGAGDAFTAGFVHAWLAGAPLRAVNEVGNLCGSFVASQEGATPVFPTALLEKVAVALHGAGQRHA